MPVCRDPAFVFIHIPKCAGSSVTSALTQAGYSLTFQGAAPLNFRLMHDVLWLHHTPARVLRKVMTESEWTSTFKFTVVRNPWERLVSFYHYRKRRPPNYPMLRWNGEAFRFLSMRPDLWSRCYLEVRRARFAQKQTTEVRPDEDFSSWLKRQLRVDAFAKAFSCSHYVCGGDTELLVDEVVRQEFLEEGFHRVCRRLSIDLVLPKINASQHADFRSYYSQNDRELVSERFRADIKLFGYTF